MFVETVKEKVRMVAERWKRQYPESYLYKSSWKDKSGQSVYAQLLALTDDATPEDVTRIIGNDTWVGVRCVQCDKRVQATVSVGEEPAYDSATASLCKPCLLSALELLEKCQP